MIKTISIIIPTYNRIKTLKKAISSVLIQLSEDIEIIIIDDGSTDETFIYLENLKNEQPHIQTILLSENKGVNFARNRGIQASSGEWIIFLDSDDFMANDSIPSIIKELKINNNKYSHFLFPVSYNYDSSLHKKKEILYSDWLSEIVSGDYTHVVKKSLLLKYPFFENYRAFEIINWLRIFRDSSPQLFINKVLINVDLSLSDSLQKQSKLINQKRIIEQFEAVNFRINYYKDDYINLAPKILEKTLSKNILLGISVGFHSDCSKLINILKSENKKQLYFYLNRPIFRGLIYILIQLVSRVNSLKK